MKLISLFVFIECPRQDSFVPTLCPPNELLAAARLFSDQTKPIIWRQDPLSTPGMARGLLIILECWSGVVRRTSGTICDENIQHLMRCDIILSGMIR